MDEFGENTAREAQAQTAERDEALFHSLQKKKKARRRRVIRTVIIVVVLVAIALTAGVLYLRRSIARRLVSDDDVSSARAERGSISTTVSGSGTLANVDEEEITVPVGVVIDEVVVKANEKIREGDVIAELDKASLLNAMETVQGELEKLDEEIYSARSDEVQNYITSGVEGTVTKIYAISGDLVIDVMAEHGCLAEILLKNGQTIRVTGLAGTISTVAVKEGAQVTSGIVLFTLRDTWFSANYDAYVQQRQEKEDFLLQLMQLYNNDGALLAPYSGSVSSVDYDEANDYSEVDEFSVVTMSPDKQMEVEISVDETNILSLEVGQTAILTVSSIGSDSYEGTVTEISKTATSSSGVTRYSAIITLDKAEEMLPGMTARAVVNIRGVENALIIPADALHQTSTKSFVYTSYDKETGEYGGLKEVEAGISNSDYVEILSGLEEGDTVWYVEKEDNPWGSFAFPGGGMPSGGMPSGGMSSGARPSGGYGGSGGGMPSGGYGGGMGGGARP
ncbi:MAG: HlyD family efflux transporter periplasmic adaptor subunit [Oscillospiraceae bacterium]|nr:HlyD family efflux transporter periplasmic adaptor subunit [Oscillospiraceae bacterium]